MLRPALDDVAEEMMEAVATIPAYARPLEGPFGDGVRDGVQEALEHFLAEIEAGGPVERSTSTARWAEGEMRAGRSLESLLSAYRIGARVAWRRFAAVGVEAGLEPDTLYLLAESIFAYIDVLSSESAEGYALEQSAAAERGRAAPPAAGAHARPRAARRARRGGRGRRRGRLAAAAHAGGGGDQRQPREAAAAAAARRARSARRSAS